MIIFASDFHLGAPDFASSLERERKIVLWLEQEGRDAEQIFLVGDLFDYWFEYRSFVPKYHVRFLGALAKLSDAGKKIHIFSGNHDVWMFDYFEKELNAIVHHQPFILESEKKKLYIAHGDGLGPGDAGYKFIKGVFRNPVCQWMYKRIHPDTGYRLATFFSNSSRNAQEESHQKYLGDENEWLYLHSQKILQTQHIDYFIYGHRHLPISRKVGPSSVFINLGDWIRHFSWAKFNDGEIELFTGFNHE